MLLWILCLLSTCISLGAEGAPRRKYMCPPDFVRHGNSCYYFSTHMEPWFQAHFKCKDRNSELAIFEKGWEDRNMRIYLNKPELARLERWIGGIYNWETKRWVWGANGGNPLKYQGFSQVHKEDEQSWNCIIMDPAMDYKWGSRSCIEEKHYICEVPLKKLQPPHPHATEPQKPRKNRDPTKVKKRRDPNRKPRDPNRKPRDPNRKPRDPNKPRRQQRQGRRHRQDLRQQRVNPRQQPVSPTPEYEKEPTEQREPQPQSIRPQTWTGHRYRYLRIQPEMLPYQEKVLI